MQSRVWFNYPGQLSKDGIGTSSSPNILLTAVENELGATSWTGTYREVNAHGLPTRSVDPEGHQVRYNYYPAGPLHPEGLHLQNVEVANAYDPVTKLPTSWRSLGELGGYVNGVPTAYTAIDGSSISMALNTKGQVTSVTRVEPGLPPQVTTYTYHATGFGAGNVATVTQSKPNGVAPALTVATYTYDSAGRVRTVTDLDAQTATYDYDNLDRVTLISYPAKTATANAAALPATTVQMDYTQNGKMILQPTAVKDRSGRWSRTIYNALMQPIVSIDPSFQTTSYEWCKCGSINKIKNQNGQVTTWKRDIQGRPTSKILADGKKYEYSYLPLSGRLSGITYPMQIGSGTPTVSFTYNVAGDLLQKKTHAVPALGLAEKLVNFFYDSLGRVDHFTDWVGTTQYTYDPVRLELGPTDVNGPLANDTLHYHYDVTGRNTRAELRRDDGSVQRFEEFGSEDGWGRALTASDTLGTHTATYAATNFTSLPDSLGSPGGVTTALTRFAAADGVNALSLKSMAVSYLSGATSIPHSSNAYTYELTGNIKSWTRTAGGASVTSNFGYDAIDQLTEEDRTTPAGLEQKAWRFDPAGNRAATLSRAGSSGPYAVETAGFNGRNQLTQSNGAATIPVEGTLNEEARVAVLPDSPSQPANPAPPVTTTVNATTKKYDPGDYTARITKTGTTSWRYSKSLTFQPGTNQFAVRAVDGKNNFSPIQRFTYDLPVSNRTSYDYDVNGNLNVVHQGTPGSFVPGGAGDGAVVKRFFWDAENQLIAFEKPAPAGSGQPDQRTTWEYDSMGRRVFEKNYTAAPGSGNWTLVETIRQWWEGTTMIQRERTFGSSPSGSIRYVLHDSGEMEHDSINATTSTRLYVTDHLGSVRGWLNVSGGAATPGGTVDYDIWGNGGSTPAGVGYTGHLKHATSGLLLAPFRAYDPVLGRWISEDPIEEAGGLNLYGYVGNAVTGAVDPLGLEGFWSDLLDSTVSVLSRDSTWENYGDEVTRTAKGAGKGVLSGVTFGISENFSSLKINPCDEFESAGGKIGEVAVATTQMGSGMIRLSYKAAVKLSSETSIKMALKAGGATIARAKATSKARTYIRDKVRGGKFMNKLYAAIFDKNRNKSWESLLKHYKGDPLKVMEAAGRTNKFWNRMGLAGFISGALNMARIMSSDTDCP